MTISGILFLLFTLLYPYIEHYTGTVNALRYSFFLFLPIILIPQIALLQYKVLIWAGIITMFVLRAIYDGIAFTSILIIVSNTVSVEYQGPVHGLAAAFTNVSGAIAPFISGPVFAFSANLHRQFNMNIPFGVIATIAVCGCIVAWLLDDKLGHPYVDVSDSDTRQKTKESKLCNDESQPMVDEADRKVAPREELQRLMKHHNTDGDDATSNGTNFEQF